MDTSELEFTRVMVANIYSYHIKCLDEFKAFLDRLVLDIRGQSSLVIVGNFTPGLLNKEVHE